MREVQLKWSPETIVNSDIGHITKVARKFEVVAHLEVTKTGVRQLVSIAFQEEMGPSDLEEIDYLDVEGPLNPYPIPEVGGEGYIVVWNRHPLSVAAINFDSLHVTGERHALITPACRLPSLNEIMISQFMSRAERTY